MNLTMEELREIARPFCGRDGVKAKIHVKPGVLAATDGRRLLHVEDPAIVPGEGDGAEERFPGAKFDSVRAIAGARKVAWLAATIVPIFEEKSRKVAEMIAAWNAEEEAAEQDVDIVECPCCGRKLVNDCGVLTDFDEWVEENRPDADGMRGAVSLAADWMDEPVHLPLRNFGMALAAAQKLGGAESLDEGEYPAVILRGRGWWIALARLRADAIDKHEPVIVARIDEEEAQNG